MFMYSTSFDVIYDDRRAKRREFQFSYAFTTLEHARHMLAIGI